MLGRENAQMAKFSKRVYYFMTAATTITIRHPTFKNEITPVITGNFDNGYTGVSLIQEYLLFPIRNVI